MSPTTGVAAKRATGKWLAFSVLALAIGAFAVTAASASAAPVAARLDTISNVSYASANLTGKASSPGGQLGFGTEYSFEYCTAECSEATATWTPGVGGEFSGAADGQEVKGTIKGLKGATTYFVRLAVRPRFEASATSSPPYASFTTLPVDPPSVTSIDDASNVSYTTATVTGKATRPANADHAFDVDCQFQYVTDARFRAAGFSGNPGDVPCEGTNPIENPGPTEVEAHLTGLANNTTYHLRLIAANASPTIAAKEAASTFKTLKVDPPSVQSIDNATEVKYTQAHVKGVVERPNTSPDPAFDINRCSFEAVSDEQFNDNPPGERFAGAAAAACEAESPIHAEGETEVEATLADLDPASTYHLRLSASNLGGNDAKEAAATFTTLAVPPPSVLSVAGATGVDQDTAEVSGEVEGPAGPDPAFDLTCRFEYVTEASFQGDEEQALTIRGTSGAFSLGFEGTSTSPLAFDAPAATVQAALAGLPGIGAGNISVRGGPGEFNGVNPYLVVFDGTLAGKDVEALTANSGTLTSISGGSANLQTSVEGGHAPGFVNPARTDCEPLSPGGPQVASVKIANLRAETTYHLRLTAENAGGTNTKDALAAFTTTQNFPPSAVVGPFTEVSGEGVTLNGEVDPDGYSSFSYPIFELSTDGVNWKISADSAEPFLGQAKLTPVTPVFVTGLRGATKYFVRLRLIGGQGEQIVISQPPYPSFITLPVDPGVVLKTNDATDLTAESAKVSGEIERPANPEPAADTNCRFEYVTDAQFDADGFQDASQTPCDIDSLMGPGERKAVEAELTDLKSGTEYHLRLTATNAGPDASLEATNSFTTVAVPVTASQTPGASDREAGYVLAGLVNPRNSTVSECKFVYGPNSEADYKKYPFAVDCSQMPASVARPVTVEGHVTGLTPDATYHSRLVVTNGFSTVVTPDQSFVPTRDAAQNCPNEQLRKENSSLALPECRAYELITPMGKEGFGARFFRVAATNSDAVAYISEAGNLFRSGTNNVFGSGSGSFYVAVRKATGWETIPDLNGASGSIRDAPSLVTTSTAGGSYSEDLLTSIWRVHRLDGLPGENFYLRNQDGSFTPIGPNNGYEGVGTFETGAYSADLTHVVRWSGGGVPAIWGPGVYETVGTKNAGAPRRLDVDNAGAPISTCLEDGGASAVGDAVSRDGRVVVFTASGGCGGANPPADEIWARVGGAASIDVSGTRCARIVPACNAPSPPKFISMSSDGSRVIITTAQQLVDTDTDDSDDIYACDIPSGSLTPSTERPNPCAALRRVSVPETGAAEVEGVEATSADGSTVLFTARGVLAANKDAIGRTAVGGDHNLYVWHLARGDQEGRISFLGHLASDDVSGQAADSPQVTSDGRYVIFSTASQLVNTDTDNARDVYRYDVGTAGLLRVSTNTLGVGGNAEGFDARGEGISEDGTKVIFQTSEPLSPADINAAPDLYLWTPTRVYLITTGAPGGGAAGLAAIDRSGENIFFHTTAELTRADGDELSDVYTARIGGGFSFDEPPSCSGEACRPPLVDPSTGPPAATSRPRPDGGNVKHKTCRKGKKLKLRKCVRKKGKNHPRRPHPVRGS